MLTFGRAFKNVFWELKMEKPGSESKCAQMKPFCNKKLFTIGKTAKIWFWSLQMDRARSPNLLK